ncbi:MAG: GSCFA domain-containing protein [Pseudoflavonifractor sp.]|nr:GSCFA domain-containing protein [Pseudoflavonifractor sp.]
MEFRTVIKPESSNLRLDHTSAIMMLGSCFSDNIGARLEREFFDVDINPVGTLYNPVSIATAIDNIMARRTYVREDLFEHDGRWHSLDHHSRFSGTDADGVLDRINSRICTANDNLRRARVLIVTLGTSWIFRLRSTGMVVGNCHKLPAAMFVRSRMTVDDIVGLWLPLLGRIRDFNPRLEVLFTVSPIRHLADGAHGNQLSKSTLLLAVDRLVSEVSEASYFPAYEALMDDLRDYRFYAADMTHPSDVAADYVYSLFCDTYMSDATRQLAASCRKVSSRLAHRPMTDNPEAVARFTDSTRQIINSLILTHPCLERAINNYMTKCSTLSHA